MRRSPSRDAHSPSPAERRRFTRVGVGLPGKVVVDTTESEADCFVTNISPVGAEIACEIERLIDTPIVLYAAGLGRFEGHIVWERDGRYGVKFNTGQSQHRAERSASAGHDKMQGSDRRRDKRITSNVRAQFMREDGSVVPCVVLDFSIRGVSLQTKVRPQLGEHVLIGGMVGKVVRFHKSGVGVEFVARQRDDASFRESLKSLDLWHIDDELLGQKDRDDSEA
jgi:hypothetical protein